MCCASAVDTHVLPFGIPRVGIRAITQKISIVVIGWSDGADLRHPVCLRIVRGLKTEGTPRLGEIPK